MNRRRIIRVILVVVLAAFAWIGAFVAFVLYSNWSAERRAREFCDTTAIGSEVASATSRANAGKIPWSPEGGAYTFYFSGFIFDKAICEISVDSERKVTSKKAEMEYD